VQPDHQITRASTCAHLYPVGNHKSALNHRQSLSVSDFFPFIHACDTVLWLFRMECSFGLLFFAAAADAHSRAILEKKYKHVKWNGKKRQ